MEMVSSPPSISRVTCALPSAISSFDAKVACGRSASAASIWPVWFASSSIACLPRMTSCGCSRSTSAFRIFATASGCSSTSVCTRMARSAPMAIAVRSVSWHCCGPHETATISVPTPFSFRRTASSTAISSNGFIDIFTLAMSTPLWSLLTRTFTLKSTTRLTGTRIFIGGSPLGIRRERGDYRESGRASAANPAGPCGAGSVPARGTLLEESLHALERRRLHHVARHRLPGELVGALDAHLELPVEEILAQRDRLARLGDDALDQRVDRRVELVGRHHAVDEAARERGLRIDELAGDEHLEGRLARHVARQRDRRRRAEQPQVHARDREARALGGDGEVAGGDQLAAGGGGDAVHARDDRLRHALDRRHQPRALREQRAVIVVRGLRAHLAQVVPGAERLARGPEDDDAHRRI